MHPETELLTKDLRHEIISKLNTEESRLLGLSGHRWEVDIKAS
jgi:hypothetical protein